MTLAIGVDVGGTKVLGGLVEPDGSVVATARRITPANDAPATLTSIVEVVGELAAGHRVQRVGLGVAGWIDAERATVLFAPNLALRGTRLRDEVSAKVQLPVVVENDANAAAWAEFRFGAARDANDSMVLLTIGTGIGSAVIFGGRLVRGAHGMAGEMGHMRAVPGGQPCGCGRRGCIEQYGSGSALVRFARSAATTDPRAAAGLLEAAGGEVDAITGPMITEAARAGDPVALAAFVQVASWLGSSLADVVQALDPQVLVLGGGVAEAGDVLLEPTRQAYLEALAQRGNLPIAPLRVAELGNTAGVVGAADLARR